MFFSFLFCVPFLSCPVVSSAFMSLGARFKKAPVRFAKTLHRQDPGRPVLAFFRFLPGGFSFPPFRRMSMISKIIMTQRLTSSSLPSSSATVVVIPRKGAVILLKVAVAVAVIHLKDMEATIRVLRYVRANEAPISSHHRFLFPANTSTPPLRVRRVFSIAINGKRCGYTKCGKCRKSFGRPHRKPAKTDNTYDG